MTDYKLELFKEIWHLEKFEKYAALEYIVEILGGVSMEQLKTQEKAVERTVAELQPDVIHILVKLLLEEALFERFKQSLEKKV